MTLDVTSTPCSAATENVLALETATARSTVAVAAEGQIHSVTLSGSRPGAGEIYGAIDAAVAAAKIGTSDLNCIAFGCGPGGFTGVRIAAAVTQGLAYGLQVPVFRCSTLHLLAAGVAAAAPEGAVIAAALDARQNEAYVGLYSREGDSLTPVVPDSLQPPAGVALPELSQPVYLAGPGWSVYPELASGFNVSVAGMDVQALPNATDLVPLALRAIAAGELTDAFSAQPNYLRDKVTD